MGNDPDGDLEEIDAVSAYPAAMIKNAMYGKDIANPLNAPYISTDRADLLRMLERIESLRKEMLSIPVSGAKVTTAQFSKLSQEIYALLALSRRIKERVEHG